MNEYEFYEQVKKKEREDAIKRGCIGCTTGGCLGCLTGVLVLAVAIVAPIMGFSYALLCLIK